MKVNYDAPGDDQTNPNGEYVALTLKGTKAVDLSYTTLWSHGNTRELGGGTVLKPGERMVIHMGKGTNTRLNHYWGKTYAPLTNSGGRHDPAHHQRNQDRLLRLGHRPLLTRSLLQASTTGLGRATSSRVPARPLPASVDRTSCPPTR